MTYKEKLNRTASTMLAAAMYETFPGITLLGGSETASGFFYDFDFPHSVHPELYAQLEEKMRQIAREKRPIRSMEMVGVSAKEFLKKHGLASRASQIEGGGLFSVIEMGSFVDLSVGELLSNTSEVFHVKIFPPEFLPDGSLRVSGSAHPSKEELKNFVKRRSEYAKTRHEVIGPLRGWWRVFSEGILWLPEGIAARERFLSLCKENLYPGGIEVCIPQGCDLQKAWDALPSAESIFQVVRIPSERSSEEGGLFMPEEETWLFGKVSFKNRISCLQSIEKTLNILGFNYRICLVRSGRSPQADAALVEALSELGWDFQEAEQREETSRVDFLVQDGLGREWSSVSVHAKKCLDVQVLVERNLAFLLEL